MASIDWGNMIGGTVFIAIGIAFIVSPKFSSFAMASTGQGIFWTKLLGPRWAPHAPKFIFSLMSIAAGVWVIYAGIYGYD